MNVIRILTLALYIIFKPHKAFRIIKEERVFLETAIIFICCVLAKSIIYYKHSFKLAVAFMLVDVILTAISIICIYYVAKAWKQYNISIIKVSEILFLSTVIETLGTAIDASFSFLPIVTLLFLAWLLMLIIWATYIVFSIPLRKACLLSFIYLMITIIFAVCLMNISIFKPIIDRGYQSDIKILKNKIIGRPENIDNYTRLGMLYGKHHEYDKAIEVFKQGMQISNEPQYTKILLYNIGLTMLAKKDVDDAIEMLQKSANLDPTYIPAKQALGSAYYEKGMHDKALEIWQKILQIDPNNKWTLEKIKAVNTK